MSEREVIYTLGVVEVVNGFARVAATRLGAEKVNKRHLAIGLIEYGLLNHRGFICEALQDLGVDPNVLLDDLIYQERPPRVAYPFLQPFAEIGYEDEARRVIEASKDEPTGRPLTYVGPQHLFMAILWDEKDNPQLGLESLGITYVTFRDAVLKIFPNQADIRSI